MPLKLESDTHIHTEHNPHSDNNKAVMMNSCFETSLYDQDQDQDDKMMMMIIITVTLLMRIIKILALTPYYHYEF